MKSENDRPRRDVRRFRNDIRLRHERLMAAVVRWGRAVDAERSAVSAPAPETSAAELHAAEEELLAVYQELPHNG